MQSCNGEDFKIIDLVVCCQIFCKKITVELNHDSFLHDPCKEELF